MTTPGSRRPGSSSGRCSTSGSTRRRRNTLNAHYTDAAYVRAIWDAVAGLGFEGGDVLEPGCGSGTFIGLAPDGARLTGWR
ncbi:hypothetical protein GCM10029963_78880 [Micromonospora andamanensis]